MDPLTAALNLANTIADIVKLTIEALPTEERAQFAQKQMEILNHWQGIFERLLPKANG